MHSLGRSKDCILTTSGIEYETVWGLCIFLTSRLFLLCFVTRVLFVHKSLSVVTASRMYDVASTIRTKCCMPSQLLALDNFCTWLLHAAAHYGVCAPSCGGDELARVFDCKGISPMSSIPKKCLSQETSKTNNLALQVQMMGVLLIFKYLSYPTFTCKNSHKYPIAQHHHCRSVPIPAQSACR